MIDFLIDKLKAPPYLSEKNLGEIVKERKRLFFHIPNSKILFVGLPGWGSPLSRWSNVEEYCRQRKISFLRYTFPREMLSANSSLTAKALLEISEGIRSDIKKLKEEYKFNRCVVIGYSLGGLLASLVYKNNSNVTDILLVCPGSNLAKDIWDSSDAQFLRKEYEEEGMHLRDLKETWKDLEPENNMPAKGARILIYCGEYDQVINYRDGKKLSKILTSNGFQVRRKDLPMGHYFTCAAFILFPGFFIRL